MAKVYAGMTLDPEVVEILKSWAEAEDRSLSYYVNQILQGEIIKREKAAELEEDNKPIIQKMPIKEPQVIKPKGRRRIVRPKEVAK